MAVVSHGFWRSAYGGSPDVVGGPISLNGHPFEIIGVAAAGFSGLQVGRATAGVDAASATTFPPGGRQRGHPSPGPRCQPAP